MEAFTSDGATVRAVVRTPSRAEHLGVEVARADLADREALTAALHGVDVLIANAALAPGHARPTDDAFRTANILGATNHLEAAAEAGVRRVIWISTVAVYQTQLFGRPDEEGAKLSPTARFDWNHLTTDRRYSSSKAAAERLAWAGAQRLGLELTVLRPGPIYGPHDAKLTARYAAQAQRRLVVAPTVKVTHVHARDVGDAAVAASNRDVSVGRAYNVTGDAVSPHHILSTWARLAKTGCRVVPLPVPLQIDFDDTRAERELGFCSRPIETGIAEIIALQRV